MKQISVITIILFTLCFKSLSQGLNSGKWETLYSTNNNDILIQIQISENKKCGDGSTPNYKFAYKTPSLTGNNKRYLVWKMDYLDCDGFLYTQERSLDLEKNGASKHLIESSDYMFVSSELIRPFYDARLSDESRQSNARQPIVNSVLPTSIIGNKRVKIGEKTTLEVDGGQLGTAAKWIWFADKCGENRIDSGIRIDVTPLQNTTYFVRAEGKGNITGCVEVSVVVDNKSYAGKSISTLSNVVCKGDQAILKVEGGSLGLNAKWVWCADSSCKQKLDTGETLIISPSKTTKYFVRAEGNENTTKCISKIIFVPEKILQPNLIVTSGLTTICEGELIKLSVVNSKLPKGHQWVWYSNECGGTPLNLTDSIIEFAPETSSTYYVRGEGKCFISECAATPYITVRKTSIEPTGISQNQIPNNSRKVRLHIEGGVLGDGATWQWYKNICNTGNKIGEGSDINVKANKTATYFVKAIDGFCNETECRSVDIIGAKLHKWDKTDIYGSQKIIQLGFGGGAEWNKFYRNGSYVVTQSGVADTFYVTSAFNSFGFKVEIPFHPVFKDYLSLGIIPDVYIAIPVAQANQSSSEPSQGNLKSYFRMHLKTELAFGFNPVKILTGMRHSFVKQELTNLIGVSKVNYPKTYNGEMLFAGIRLGRYAPKSPAVDRGSNIDILYTLAREKPEGYNYSLDNYKDLSDWNVGFGFSWWRHSVFKLQFDTTFTTLKKDLKWNEVDFSSASYQVSFVFCGNWFY